MNFSRITDHLFIGNTPSLHDYDRLRELGIRLIINMRFTRGPQPDPHPFDAAQGKPRPISTLWLRSIDSPLFPIPIQKLMRGAQTALETIREGGRVYAHCAYGRHRGPAMGACILIAQGFDPHEAMELIVKQRPIANPYAYYIQPRILKFAREWTNRA
jgi:dual specificity MAP kinase phosphatase